MPADVSSAFDLPGASFTQQSVGIPEGLYTGNVEWEMFIWIDGLLTDWMVGESFFSQQFDSNGWPVGSNGERFYEGMGDSQYTGGAWIDTTRRDIAASPNGIIIKGPLSITFSQFPGDPLQGEMMTVYTLGVGETVNYHSTSDASFSKSWGSTFTMSIEYNGILRK